MSEETLPPNDPAEPAPAKTAVGDCPSEAPAEAADETSSDHKSHHAPPIPGWLLSVLGHMLAGVLGLILGWLILNWLRPDSLPPWLRL
jgi:hypothetical protein